MTDTVDERAEHERDVPMMPLEYRAAETLEVRYPDRVLVVLAAPYERETARAVNAGRRVMESFARGTFDGIERRANRVTVNRDHDLARTVGRAVAFHPASDDGLIADLKISQTPLGDETLELAADGALGPSVAFAPMRGGESWTEGRSRRRLTKAWLGHIALVPDPAYDDADVLAVRSAAVDRIRQLDSAIEEAGSVPTPHKDELLARLAELGYHPRP
jgi:HK97 family phage prohead protease